MANVEGGRCGPPFSAFRLPLNNHLELFKGLSGAVIGWFVVQLGYAGLKTVMCSLANGFRIDV